MKQETLLKVVHENPQSTILIEKKTTKKVVRIDIDEYNNFNVQHGEGLKGVDIYKDEKERRKRRKDLKMKLSNGGFEDIKNVYAISRIDEQKNDGIDISYVQKQQRDRGSPGS